MRGKKKRKAEAEAAAASGVALGPERTAPPAGPSKGPKPPKRPKPPRATRRPKGPARQTRLTRLVGLVFCAAGFGAIALGWAGAAGKDCVQCQMPYVLSGGALGLGLLVFGAAMMVMAQLRTEGRRLADRLEGWRSSSPPDAGAGTNGRGPATAVAEAEASSPPSAPPQPVYSLQGEGPDPAT